MPGRYILSKAPRVLVFSILLTITLCVSFRSTQAREQDNGRQQFQPTVSADLSLLSKYVWRGIEVTDGGVFQPGFTGSYRGLSFNTWGNLDMTDTNNMAGDFNEIDLTLDYAFSWEMMSFDFGFIHYTFPNTGALATTELFASASADVFLSPSLTIYQDIDEGEGTYLSLGIAYGFDSVWKASDNISMSINLSLSIGFGSSEHNEFYYSVDKSRFTDLLFNASAPITLSDHWSVSPEVHVSTLLDGDIRDSMRPDANIWGGITVSCRY